MEHICSVCFLPGHAHDGECDCGERHWPPLCCPGCDCGSYEESHRTLPIAPADGSRVEVTMYLTGRTTYETCPVCFREPFVAVLHGTGPNGQPRHHVQCPECGPSFVDVTHDCPFCQYLDSLAFAQAANALLSPDGKLSYLQVGMLAIHFGLSPEDTFEQLHREGLAPTGAYERMVEGGLTSLRLIGLVSGATPHGVKDHVR